MGGSHSSNRGTGKRALVMSMISNRQQGKAHFAALGGLKVKSRHHRPRLDLRTDEARTGSHDVGAIWDCFIGIPSPTCATE